MGASDDDKKAELDLLVAHYSEMRKETLLQISSIKTHVRNSHIVISAMVSITLALFSYKETTLSPSYAWFWFFLMLVATTITFYLFHSVMESIFSMNVLGAYLSVIEDRVNKLVGSDLLIWETVVCRNILHQPVPFKGILHPIPVMNFYPIVTILAVGAIVPILIYWMISTWWLEYWKVILLWLAGGYSAISFAFACWIWWGANRMIRIKTLEYLQDRLKKDGAT